MAAYGKQKWAVAGSKILFPRLGVLNTVQQGPAVRAWVPSSCLPFQERIQARRQKVNRVKKSLQKKRTCGKTHWRTQREKHTFGKFKSFIREQSYRCLSSFWPVVLFWPHGQFTLPWVCTYPSINMDPTAKASGRGEPDLLCFGISCLFDPMKTFIECPLPQVWEVCDSWSFNRV